MGGYTAANGDPTGEVAHRVKLTMDACGMIRKQVLANPRLPRPTRVSVTASLCEARLLFNCHTWIGVAEAHVRALQFSIVRMLRVVCGTSP
eukprot:3269896-Alexandrium_andersonii.AAC.1